MSALISCYQRKSPNQDIPKSNFLIDGKAERQSPNLQILRPLIFSSRFLVFNNPNIKHGLSTHRFPDSDLKPLNSKCLGRILLPRLETKSCENGSVLVLSMIQPATLRVCLALRVSRQHFSSNPNLEGLGFRHVVPLRLPPRSQLCLKRQGEEPQQTWN